MTTESWMFACVMMPLMTSMCTMGAYHDKIEHFSIEEKTAVFVIVGISWPLVWLVHISMLLGYGLLALRFVPRLIAFLFRGFSGLFRRALGISVDDTELPRARVHR